MGYSGVDNFERNSCSEVLTVRFPATEVAEKPTSEVGFSVGTSSVGRGGDGGSLLRSGGVFYAAPDFRFEGWDIWV